MLAPQRPLLLTLLLAACGPEPATTDASTSAPTSAADPTDTPTPTTGAPFIPAVCDAPAGTIDPFPDPATCADYPGSIGVAELEIGIINLRSTPVFVHGDADGIARRLRLTGERGGRSVHAPHDCDDDPPSCDSLIDQTPNGCGLIGIIVDPLRLEPGARHVLRWTPYLAFPVTLPASCQPATPSEQTCTTALPPVAGAYTLSLTYAETCAGPCTCEPDPDGSCTVDGTLDTILPDPPLTAQAHYDGVCAVVDIVIE